MAKFHEMMKPILNMLKAGGCIEIGQIRELMNQQFPLTGEEMEMKLSKGQKPDISQEVRLALLHLTRAGLLNNPERGVYSITNEGLEVLSENPEIIDTEYLSKYESFRALRQLEHKSAEGFELETSKKMLLVCAPVKTCIAYKSEIKNHPHSSDFISARYDVFINELIDSIRNSNTNEFRQKYINCKVFILYDVEFFAGKENSQEELYHIIQARIEYNLKTVIISSETPKVLSEILTKKLYEILTIESVINQIPASDSEKDTLKPYNDNHTGEYIDIQSFKQKLQITKKQLENKEIDEIPFDSRPKMLDFDFDNDSYVIVSYSRKDFEEVYLLLAQLYNEEYRFWYDNGMKGTNKWLDEYKDKFKNPNCLGTITFFSNNYISDSTKAELEIIYSSNRYEKRNVMISLMPLNEIDTDQILINAISDKRITIANAYGISQILTEIIEEEKKKTIHRYSREADIPFLVDKIGAAFNIRGATSGSKGSIDYVDSASEQK